MWLGCGLLNASDVPFYVVAEVETLNRERGRGREGGEKRRERKGGGGGGMGVSEGGRERE